ncbi:hypothetical protein ACL02U_09730 [Streptomyces sp. MS06]|uniref:hypothetical protein n=1 Tax=Streptomyces sp. MS06 TaxID=3385974 RepID=UPI0039A1A1B0
MPCPTPTKKRFATQTAADRAARRATFALDQTLHPYRCPCTWWHLTSKPPTS